MARAAPDTRVPVGLSGAIFLTHIRYGVEHTLWGGALKCAILQFHLSPMDLQGLLLVVLAICGGQWRKYMSFGVRQVWVQIPALH